MDNKEMKERIEAGDKIIDITITKWENILEGTGKNYQGNNCAYCYNSTIIHGWGCEECILNTYGLENQIDPGCCGGFYTSTMTYEQKQCMLSYLYVVKEEMIKDGIY